MKYYGMIRQIIRSKEFNKLIKQYVDIMQKSTFKAFVKGSSLKIEIKYLDKTQCETINFHMLSSIDMNDFESITRTYQQIFKGSDKLWKMEQKYLKSQPTINGYPRSLDPVYSEALRKFLWLKHKKEIDNFTKQFKLSIGDKLKKTEINRLKTEFKKTHKYLKERIRRAMNANIHENEIRKMWNQILDKNRMINDIKVEQVLTR